MKPNRNQSNFLKDVEQRACAGIDVGLQMDFEGNGYPVETMPTDTVKETVKIFEQHKKLKEWLGGTK